MHPPGDYQVPTDALAGWMCVVVAGVGDDGAMNSCALCVRASKPDSPADCSGEAAVCRIRWPSSRWCASLAAVGSAA